MDIHYVFRIGGKGGEKTEKGTWFTAQCFRSLQRRDLWPHAR